MSEFNEGDLVEATKGETVIRGRAEKYGIFHERLWFEEVSRTFDALHYQGFTLKLIEKAPAVLPNIPDWYFDDTGELWQLVDTGEKLAWFYFDGGELNEQGLDVVRDYAPFRRAVPEAT